MDKKAEFKHGEAFMVMNYGCDTCNKKEFIWNSRDGVTPFVVKCRYCKEGSLRHVDWGRDVYKRNYNPALGDLVFVTQTEEEYIESAKTHASQIWLNNEDCRHNYESMEEFQKLLVGNYKEGQPIVRQVGYVNWNPTYK